MCIESVNHTWSIQLELKQNELNEKLKVIDSLTNENLTLNKNFNQYNNLYGRENEIEKILKILFK